MAKAVFPASLDELVADDHLLRVVGAYACLDLRRIGIR